MFSYNLGVFFRWKFRSYRDGIMYNTFNKTIRTINDLRFDYIGDYRVRRMNVCRKFYAKQTVDFERFASDSIFKF